jgi:putative oxidoreductase
MRKWFFSNSTVDPVVSFGLLLFRVGIGTMMLTLHGWDKYQNFAQKKEKFPVPDFILLNSWMNSTTALAFTIFAEVVCCALIILGIATRFGAAVLAFTMAIAAFVVHGKDTWAVKEMALLYLAASVLLLFTGAGAYSFDARFSIVKKRMFN